MHAVLDMSRTPCVLSFQCCLMYQLLWPTEMHSCFTVQPVLLCRLSSTVMRSTSCSGLRKQSSCGWLPVWERQLFHLLQLEQRMASIRHEGMVDVLPLSHVLSIGTSAQKCGHVWVYGMRPLPSLSVATVVKEYGCMGVGTLAECTQWGCERIWVHRCRNTCRVHSMGLLSEAPGLNRSSIPLCHHIVLLANPCVLCATPFAWRSRCIASPGPPLFYCIS